MKSKKVILVIIIILILLLSITICLYSLNLIELGFINHGLEALKEYSVMSVGLSILLILLSIKGIFFKAKTTSREKSSDGVLLKNDNGKLVISKETIENIVNGVAKGFNGTQNVSTKLFVSNNSISVLVNLQIVGEVSISDLSINLQNKIKEAVKKITNLELSEVNIRVKNISDIDSKPAVQNEPVKVMIADEEQDEK